MLTSTGLTLAGDHHQLHHSLALHQHLTLTQLHRALSHLNQPAHLPATTPAHHAASDASCATASLTHSSPLSEN
ncbi:MAG: hypothetical protein Tsb009_12590 [Planctomycetaceae bacterium]